MRFLALILPMMAVLALESPDDINEQDKFLITCNNLSNDYESVGPGPAMQCASDFLDKYPVLDPLTNALDLEKASKYFMENASKPDRFDLFYECIKGFLNKNKNSKKDEGGPLQAQNSFFQISFCSIFTQGQEIYTTPFD
ncbi:unnamed protein product [Ceutorhynchus assimilis]|uniref:Uncharacterized protein n=1 Tax=Ceutorhynchus assimilis TaxID=467358 RepID=A0A9N9MKX7_9CUCU|nr:unnamed protein product [Ceutorhynchus assimilis]